jgi:hypothetical protein
MNLINFLTEFPTEESCKLKFRQIREKEGVTCKKCGCKNHYWKKDKEQFQCKKCGYRTTLRSGTVMHHSKLPFQYWFIAMHLLTSTKKSFSALEVQRQLGHKRYEPIWAMLHKIRAVMGLRDDNYVLKDSIEIDEGFFETVNSDEKKEEQNKRGRGSLKQTKVLVMVESKEVPQDKHIKNKPTKKVGYLKMKVIQNLKSETINEKIEKGVEKNTNSVSDDYSSYKKITKHIVNNAQKVTKDDVNKILPWVHIAISNAKRLLLDIHHRIDDDFLNNYLNEYCYKFNRRYFKDGLMERILVASVNHKWDYLG